MNALLAYQNETELLNCCHRHLPVIGTNEMLDLCINCIENKRKLFMISERFSDIINPSSDDGISFIICHVFKSRVDSILKFLELHKVRDQYLIHFFIESLI